MDTDSKEEGFSWQSSKREVVHVVYDRSYKRNCQHGRLNSIQGTRDIILMMLSQSFWITHLVGEQNK